MKKTLLFVLALIALLPVSSEAQTVNMFRQWDRSSRAQYMSGYTDGLSAGLLAAEDDLMAIIACIYSGWTPDQARAVVDKYLDEHPEDWNRPAATQVLFALMEACPRRE